MCVSVSKAGPKKARQINVTEQHELCNNVTTEHDEATKKKDLLSPVLTHHSILTKLNTHNYSSAQLENTTHVTV